MMNRPSFPDWYAAAPGLLRVRNEVLFGDVWERTELSKRDRSLITLAALTALYRTEELQHNMGRALDNGVTTAEIAEVITHMALYAGWPCGVNAGRVAKQVFDARGLEY
jgi:4-carboxymuconolactone decarboxylase